MIANFFQSLSVHGVEYLLISGQATVLYGAATFSEDIDLWVNPTSANRDRFLTALRSAGARYYKLTPPLTIEHLVSGHGFHFLLSGETGDEVYLDVMGAPPRVGSFAVAIKSSQWINTEWGNLHTVGIRDLVELKKTQRLADYPIISKLALAWCEQPAFAGDPQECRWILGNIFTLPELRACFETYPAAAQNLPEDAPNALGEFARQLLATGDVDEPVEESVADWMQQRMSDLQQADRRYWKEIIAELRRLRAERRLEVEGSAV